MVRGEQTAAALEKQLSQVESRIDQLLASVDNSTEASSAGDPAAKDPSKDQPKENGISGNDQSSV